ncbi:MAG: glycosyltransferase, partial [Pseudomonadota bacterium]
MSHSDGLGGAPIAAYRLHRALRAAGLASRMAVDHATTGDWSVAAPKGALAKLGGAFRPRIGAAILRGFGPRKSGLHSVAVLPGRLQQRLGDADIAHLHWINSEMTSVAEIGRLTQPVIWTLHDMWPFCGTEHYASDGAWKSERGIGIDGWTWRRKRRHWGPMQLVAPSRWLADRVAESALMGSWPVRVIPNPIDLDIWAPVDKRVARDLMGLP